eukprot:126649-Alexandrium_andersonii.AAC.1
MGFLEGRGARGGSLQDKGPSNGEANSASGLGGIRIRGGQEGSVAPGGKGRGGYMKLVRREAMLLESEKVRLEAQKCINIRHDGRDIDLGQTK